MKDSSRITPQDFEMLLSWLDDNREEAGKKYEQIRKGLIRFFRFKGCADAETLTDETFTRVAEKVLTFDTSKNFKTITYFYGFASNILLEDLRNRKREGSKIETYSLYQKRLAEFDNESAEIENECLHKCLANISDVDRQIFVKYYAFENGQKAQIRREIAESLGCEMNTLHVKVFRLRDVLKKCIKNCLKKKM